VGGKNPEHYPPPIDDRLSLRKWAEDYPAWALAIRCTRCVHSGIIYPGKLRHPYARRIGDLKARLYCPDCGSRQFWIVPAFLRRRD
jgi:hypothetical protein